MSRFAEQILFLIHGARIIREVRSGVKQKVGDTPIILLIVGLWIGLAESA